VNRVIVWGLALAALVAFALTLAGERGLLGGGERGGERAGEAGALVGGPFTLVDGAGRTVTDVDFRGSYMLVFFGFTRCPDLCPTTLQRVAEVLDRLGDAAQAIQPIFITLDPERDDPATLAAYVAHFHPRLIGLGGSPEQVAAAAAAYRVYWAKVPLDGSPEGDYTIDHSGYLYLMGPDGQFVDHFSHQGSADEIAQRLRDIVG